jgi:hypothetical protein
MSRNDKTTPTAKLAILASCLGLALQAAGGEFFASPDGSPQGDGTSLRPWDLATALADNTKTQNVNNVVKSGDTIWLRGGTYGMGSNIFTCALRGTSNNSIVVRQSSGERSIINGGIDATDGGWTTFWGFEITCSNARTNIYANRPTGLIMDGVGHKAVNLVIHDTGHPGIASYQNEGNGREIYGCIIWGVGVYQYADNGDIDARYTTNNPWTRGAGMYLQNRDHTFSISDNISGRNFTSGIKSYGENGYVSGFVCEGNVVFGNDIEGIYAECLYNSITNYTVINNYSYRSGHNAAGYFSGDNMAQHHGLIYSNNYVVGYPGFRLATLWLKRWTDMQVVANTVITTSFSNEWVTATGTENGAGSGKLVELYPGTNAILSMTINNNAYYGGVEHGGNWYDVSGTNYGPYYHTYQPFRYKDYTNELSFVAWTNIYGFDLNSSHTTNLPTANVVDVRPNKYEVGRGHIVVFNWQSNSIVSVDISSLGLTNGQRFEVRDAQNYLGTPVLTINYNAAQPVISLPLTMTNVTAVTGGVEHNYTFNPNVHTASLFNAFVVLPIYSSLGTAPPPPTGLKVFR